MNLRIRLDRDGASLQPEIWIPASFTRLSFGALSTPSLPRDTADRQKVSVAHVRLRIGNLYELRIALGDGNAICVVVP